MTKLEEFYFQNTPKEHLDFLESIKLKISQNLQMSACNSCKIVQNDQGGG